MGVKYLWDTNTAIYFLQQLFPPSAERFVDDLLLEGQPAISAITEIELLCWKAATEKDVETIQHFITDTFVIELEKNIKLKTAEIRKQHRLKLPDAIIAATALVHKLTLVTRNDKDFEDIADLSIINPWKQ